jgi:hypothetical protein
VCPCQSGADDRFLGNRTNPPAWPRIFLEDPNLAVPLPPAKGRYRREAVADQHLDLTDWRAVYDGLREGEDKAV